MRRTVAALGALVTAVCLVLVPSASVRAETFSPPPVSPFTDVATSHVFYAQIAWLADRGISTGYVDGPGRVSFRPSAPVLREQMAAFLYRAEGSPPVTVPATSPFVDVSPSHPFYRPIVWMLSTGISTGYVDATGLRRFEPSAPVLREQMAAFLHRLEGQPSVSLPSSSPFVDVSPGHVFYRAMVWLAQRGITTGYAEGAGRTSFRPSEPVLREQMAAFLYRLEGVEPPPAAAPAPVTDLVATPSSTAVTLTWRLPSGAAPGGVVVRRSPGTSAPTGPTAGELVADLGPAAVTTTDTGRTPSTTVSYAVFVRSTQGTFSRAATVTVTTTAASQEFQSAPAPTISGTPRPGSTLTVVPGSWTPAATFTQQWIVAGTPVEGATATTFVPGPEHAGKAVTVRVVGSRSGYTSATRTSAPVTISATVEVVTVSGTVAASTTWSPDAARVYRVSGDLVVPAGVTLTLRAGTVVKLGPAARIRVAGTLRAEGTAASSVVLTSVRDDAVVGDTNGDGRLSVPLAGDHEGLEATGAGSIRLAGTQVIYAQSAVSATGDDTAMPTLALTDTAISRSIRCVVASGPVNGTFSGSVRDCELGVSATHAFDARGVDWGSTSGPFPYGTGVPTQGEAVVVSPWTGFVAPARPALAAPQAPARRSTCEELMFLGVRGSGEAPSSQGPRTPGTFDSDESGFGSYNYVIAAYLAQQVAVLRPGTTVRYHGVQYIAVQIPNYDTSVDYAAFLASVYDGVDKLDQLVAAESARCPSSRFVLVGSSQGALIIQLWMAQTTSATTQSRVAGAVLLASPTRLPGSPETLWEGAGVPASAAVRDVGGGWAGYFPAFQAQVPSWAASRTISMCHQGDVFCAFAPGAHLQRHLDYSTAELQALAEWQAPRVVARLPAS